MDVAKNETFFKERFAGYKDLTPEEIGESDHAADPTYGSRYTARLEPKASFPKDSMPPRAALNICRDMHQLDANPRLDLASFTTTWMEPEADELIALTQSVNIVDMAQYPQCTEMDLRCTRMLADLWHAPKPKSDAEGEQPLGTSTIGSSEACMLGGLALKRRWQTRRKKLGLPTDKPNIVMGANAQVCWHKFQVYFEIEPRYVPVTVDMPVMTPDTAKKYIDENTIGIVTMAGSTYNGQFEDVEGLDKLCAELNAAHDWDLRIHVDGASGGQLRPSLVASDLLQVCLFNGLCLCAASMVPFWLQAFVAPFIFPDYKFDFRLEHVASINASGHKYGLVYPGVGWVIWRNRACVDESLIFKIDYLGVDQPTIQINFSKNANMVVAQYYQFIRLGFEGYRKIMTNLMKIASYLAHGILSTGHFRMIGGGMGLPVVAFALKEGRKNANGEDAVWDEFDLSDRLKQHHWQIPAYALPQGAEHQHMLRCVVREDLSMEMANDLVSDVTQCVEWLDHHFIFSEDKMKELRGKFAVNHPQHNKKKAPSHVKHSKHRAGVC